MEIRLLREQEDLHLMSVAPGGLIRQRIHGHGINWVKWDHENAISFNVHLLEVSRYQKTTGLPPPLPAMSEAEYSKLNLFYFMTDDDLAATLGFPGVEYDLEDTVRSICHAREINEASHPMGVVKLEPTGPAASRASPYAEMLAMAQRLNCDAPVGVERKPIAEWWRRCPPPGNGHVQTSGSTNVVNGLAALVAPAGQSNGTAPSGEDKTPRKHRRWNKAKSKCIVM
jgi:hypothetical protein